MYYLNYTPYVLVQQLQYVYIRAVTLRVPSGLDSPAKKTISVNWQTRNAQRQRRAASYKSAPWAYLPAS